MPQPAAARRSTRTARACSSRWPRSSNGVTHMAPTAVGGEDAGLMVGAGSQIGGGDVRVALATVAEAAPYDRDRPALLAALADVGVDASAQDWDDHDVDWHAFDLVVVRST